MTRTLQRLTRARMDHTGERYTKAAQELLAARDDPGHVHDLVPASDGPDFCPLCGLEVPGETNPMVNDASDRAER